MLGNEPIWIEVDCVGEKTGQKYFGRFQVKRYLTHKENSDVSRLYETYTRGIVEDIVQKSILYMLAQLAFQVLQSDAAWWNNSEQGQDLFDDEPILKLAMKIKEKPEVKDDSKKEEVKA